MVLLGTSVGGAIALDFALAEPQAVSRLVLLSAQVGARRDWFNKHDLAWPGTPPTW